MDTKAQIMTTVRDEFNQWQALVGNLDEATITAPNLHDRMSIKDIVVHLWGWQQLSIARMKAALHDTKLQFDLFPEGLETEDEDDVIKINAWIDDTHKHQSWSDVYANWKTGFQQLLDLAEAIPEAKWFDDKRYTWIEGYPLSAVMTGTHEHHQEHRDDLVDWLNKQDQ